MNSTKGAKNIFWGLMAQIITIGVGVLIPRLVLVNLGSESNGLMNSVSSVLTYLSLLEAGVGTATVQALFSPIAKTDRDSINRIMSATHYFYRRTGFVYLALVAVLTVGYTIFAVTELPKLYVFLVVFISGLSGVLSYFFQGKYRLLLSAEGKGYIVTNISTVTSVGVSLTKAIVLIAGGNVVAVQLVYFVYNLLQMLFFSFYMRKHYKWLDLSVEPDFKAIAQRNAVLIHQIANLIFYNTDTVILTVLTNLKVVSVYSMYAMIFGMVKSVTVSVSDGVIFAMGQAWHDRPRFNKMFSAYETYNTAMTFLLFTIAGILMIPFLRLYTSGVTDINYIDSKVSILFLVYYLMDNGRKPSSVVINIAQHFEKTKWHAILEAVINLTSSIFLTMQFGIYGVLMGTIIALLFRGNIMIIYASRLLNRSCLVTYKRWGLNILLSTFMLWGSKLIEISPDNYFKLIIYGIIITAVAMPVFLGVNSIANIEAAKYTWSVAKGVIMQRFKTNKQ